MKYHVLTHWRLFEFINSVNELISKGWEPQGGVSTAVDQSNIIMYTQAFIKKA